MKFSLRLATLVLPATMLMVSCSKDDKKDSGNNNEESSKLTTANVTAEAMFEDANTEIMIATQQNGMLSVGARSEDGTITTLGATGATGTNGCATVTVTPQGQTFPKTVVIDYGTSGCTGVLGYTHKGKITYSITNRFIIPGSTIVATFENYSVNGYKVEGTYTVTNATTGNAPAITTQVTGGKITYPDGTWYTHAGLRNFIQTSGVQTLSIAEDDEFSVTGSSSITASDNRKLDATIKTPLLKKFTCPNIVSGTVDFTYNNVKGLWSYGEGACDKTATITVGNWVGTITLP